MGKTLVSVALGSKNPVKLQATRSAFKRLLSNTRIHPVAVPSGVGVQPYDREVVRGAVARAREARRAIDADFGVGIEGGIVRLYGAKLLCACCAIVARDGERHLGYAPMIELPQKVLRMASKRLELGDVMDSLTGRRNVKQSEGAIGVYSSGAVTRKEALELAVLFALSPFVNKEWRSANEQS